jgi:hypothetical protein
MSMPLRLLCVLVCASCSSVAGYPGDASRGGTSGGTFTGAPESEGGTDGSGGGAIQAGTLTAGAWDDNLNFDFFLDYVDKVEKTALAGLPKAPRDDRMVITVTDGAGWPLAGAQVTVSDGGLFPRFEAPTGADGRALFFPKWAGAGSSRLTVSASSGGREAHAEAQAGDPEVTLKIDGAESAPVRALDVALVIDTTGSMGDEMNYLRVELDAIASSVAGSFPGVEARWALVVYRDDGDEYVVRQWDFTADLEAFKAKLGEQTANGGGDMPEAPERGLAAAAGLSWRGGAAARLAFLVADAPHHAGREGALLDAVQIARGKGVRIYPVAASGADTLFEYTMRGAAQLTGGRYLFLTDDSGVGDPHLEPTLPCYFVTRLDRAMVRMISIELSGQVEEPASEEVLRVGGDPRDGRCVLADGRVVAIL